MESLNIFYASKMLVFIKNQPACFLSLCRLSDVYITVFPKFFKLNRSFTFKSNSDVLGSFIGPTILYLKNKYTLAPKLKC
jgi:hypothetical protein